MLRVVTYLAPALPMAYFEGVVDWLGHALDRPVTLTSVTERSGPSLHEPDPFASGNAEVAFMCSPSYAALGAMAEAIASPAFADPRAGGRPVYFSDVVVRRNRQVDLRDATWAVNDPTSLSGYLCVVHRFGDRAGLRWSGSHWTSMDLVASGEADAAAIDSNVLTLRLRERPDLASRLRVVESWGPFPVQPVVARADLGRELLVSLTGALVAMGDDPAGRRHLAEAGVIRFVSGGEDAATAE